ncbi:hypothetical protein DSO57_1037740 [Entomophthora muscae]|nr:hypothetical protein DSO57_1037740 [Entomophthora muscae]
MKTKQTKTAKTKTKPRQSKKGKTKDSIPQETNSPKVLENVASSTAIERFECYICSAQLECTENEFISHLDLCSGFGEDDNESLQEIPLSLSGELEPNKKNKTPEENEEVDVDAIDMLYGRPQFTSEDLRNFYPKGVVPNSNLIPRSQQVRDSTRVNLSPNRPFNIQAEQTSDSLYPSGTHVPPLTPDLTLSSDTITSTEQPLEHLYTGGSTIGAAEPNHLVIATLKAEILRLRASQNSTSESSSCCLICYDSFKEPMVSIGCWHVYCCECWLQTMGVKKLCPQCQRITFPEDLRRIYL